ncbi:MAG: hypothetical protein O3A10_07695 [Chloroflexi bacterium]|nr:hypothetical protein [Chloroflexota bacterium]MDA1145752.1 hypothetical protein [Chloroflexota bacterium]
MAEGFRIRIVDLSGRPLDDLVSDQTFRIELYVPDTMADPGNTTEIEFVTSEGTADLDITWTNTIDGEWVFTSTPLSVSGGGEGAGEVGALGFSWSTGNLDRGEIDYEDGKTLTVRFESADGVVAEDDALLYDTPISMGLFQTGEYIAKADEVFNATLVNITAARAELDQYPESGEKDEIQAALDALEADTLQRLSYVVAASGSLNRDAWTERARLAVAQGYLDYLQQPPELLGAIPWTDALSRERANKERSDAEVSAMVLRGIGAATIGAYRLFAAATLVAQVRTLLFGVNEMGQEVGWDQRTLALLDLITEVAMTGAGMKFQLDHLATPTRQRVIVPPAGGDTPLLSARGLPAYEGYGPRPRSTDPGSPGRSAADLGDAGGPTRATGNVGAPRFRGDNLAHAETGDILSPEQVGMMREAMIDAQRIARKPRDGHPNGTLGWTRPSNIAGLRWRRLGNPPKGVEIKSKTINDIDVLLGAELGTQGLVGFFEPVLPSRASFDPAFFAKIEGRFNQRMNEFNGGIGEHMRQLEADGQIRFDNGVVVDTGLYGNTGKGITGDYDLFEITDLDGNPVSTAVYDAVVADLMNSEAFLALHGAHMRWLDMPDFRKPSKLADNLSIFTDVIGKHQRGGEEPLVVFGGDRPPFAVWSEDLPTRHLADLPQNIHAAFARNVSPNGTLISGISPLFLDRDADDDWEDDWDAIVAQSHAVLGRRSLTDDADDEVTDNPEDDAAWEEWIRQAEAAGRDPSILDFLNESPFASVIGPADASEGETEIPEEPDPEWDAVVAQAEARSQGSILDHESGLDDEPDASLADLDRLDTLGEQQAPPEESVLNYLGGEADLGKTPVPPAESVLDYIDPEAERSPSSPFEAVDRELATAATSGASAAGQPPRRRVPIWVWPLAGVVAIALGAFLLLGGGDADEPSATGASGGAGGVAPTSTAAPTRTAAATVLATAAPSAPAGGATMTPAQIPTLVICPDGSSFSGFEQADGAFLDASTGETRVCPPPPN